ncbi:MAG: DUF1893 domain-containing protein [Ruminococcus sp.]|nr:DUF1893 domain-containing protein [Ruminococcus sp.]
MNSNTQRCIELLKREGFTCVLSDGGNYIKSYERGVSPLVKLICENKNLAGFSAADKIVGKAAALLYAKLKVCEVYADVLSEGAISVFEKYKISCYCSQPTDNILNRQNTGLCPMEQAVLEIDDPDVAFEAIKLKLSELSDM